MSRIDYRQNEQTPMSAVAAAGLITAQHVFFGVSLELPNAALGRPTAWRESPEQISWLARAYGYRRTG
jgi:hypothetical protein